MKRFGDHEVEVREQVCLSSRPLSSPLFLFSSTYYYLYCSLLILLKLLQAADENWDSLGKRQVWRCESTKLVFSPSTDHDKYCMKFTPTSNLLSARSVTTVKEYGDYQREVMAEQHKPEWTRKIRGQARGFKMLRFGTNCDLSDKDK